MPSRVGLAARRALLLVPFAGAVASAQTLGGLSERGTGAGFGIADGQVRSSSISVSGITNRVIGRSANNQTVVVQLNTLTHTWVGDLNIRLSFQSAVPLSQTINWTIMNRPGCFSTAQCLTFSDNFNGSYSFGEGDPASGSFMGDFNDFWAFNNPIGGANLPSGDYFPFDELNGYDSPSKFEGLDPNGTWTLHITDFVTGDVGALTSWNLAFDVVPEPSSYALLTVGLGALVAAARRRRSV